jgi:hypothetical protein
VGEERTHADRRDEVRVQPDWAEAVPAVVTHLGSVTLSVQKSRYRIC